ncbi:MAG: hypothetical protein Q8N37_00320 [bacterium]|nr:hypothetical protein [bacterium]
MPTLYTQLDKNTHNRYILGVFIFLFLFFQPLSLDSSFSETKTFGINIAKAACPTGFADCDGNSLNACEVDLLTDKNNCGYCGVKCNGACTNGQCLKIAGGLISCGRLSDNCVTPIDESAPCGLCALFYMLKNIINFVMTLTIGVGVFILVITGLLYAFSAGNSRKIELAKSAVTSAITGIAIVFIAWLVIAVILQGMGYANMATWNQVNCNMPSATVTCVCGDGIWDPELGESCDGLSGVARSPEESSPSHQYACTASCTPTGGYAGDGIVNGPEICDQNSPITNDCSGIYTTGLPAWCTGVPVAGTQTCNSTSTDWGACTVSEPLPVGSSSTACSSTSPQMNDYACCELVSCTKDGCDCCGRPAGAAIPGGYTNVQSLSPCGTSNNSCRLNQSIAIPRNWTITTNHTTAAFRCWE